MPRAADMVDTMKKPYRNGSVHVCREMCATCIFRPGNLMSLQVGRVAQMVHTATLHQSAIICHETLDANQAVCHGFFKKHATGPLRIADRLNLITFVETT